MKLCWFCKHCRLDLGETDLSEVTPGGPGYLECLKSHFDYNGDDDVVYLKDIVSHGLNCPDFEWNEEIRQMVEKSSS